MKRALWSDAPPVSSGSHSPVKEPDGVSERQTQQEIEQPATYANAALRLHLGYAIVIAAVLGANAFHPSIPTIIAAGCGIAVLVSPLRALQALSVLAVVRYLNPTLVTYDPYMGAMSWVVLLLVAGRYGWMIFRQLPPTSIPLICFTVLVLAASLVVSPIPVISSLKLIAFSATALALLSIAQKATDREREIFLTWCFTLAVVVLLLSVPFFFIPAVGFETNGRGFQGILNQPQPFGVFFAPMTVCLIIKFIFARKGKMLDILVMSSFILTIILSQARTSALAVLCGVLVVYLILILGSSHHTRATSKGSAILITIALCLVGGAAFVFLPEVKNEASEFVFKRGPGAENVEEEFMRSRGAGAAYQFTHFLESPLLGHGFGIPSSGRFHEEPTRVFGIPISAPTEKGFLPTAILEETGILGTSFFVWWMVAAFRLAFRDPSGIPACLVAAGLFVNLGEMSFFSVNSLGLLFFALIAVAVAHGASSERKLTPTGPNNQMSP